MNSRLGLLLYIALYPSACTSGEAACAEFGSQQSAIKFGEPDAGVNPIPAEETLFALHWQTSDDPEPKLTCTATRIVAGGFLTARHCIPDEFSAASDAEANEEQTTLLLSRKVLDDGASPPCGTAEPLRVQRVAVHDALDVAVLYVDDDENNAMTARMQLPKATASADQALYIAGFGLTETASLGELRALPALLQRSDEQKLEVQAIAGGACVGDSGGPLYGYSADTQRATLFGVLSMGSATCLGGDVYIDIAKLLPWLDEVLPDENSP